MRSIVSKMGRHRFYFASLSARLLQPQKQPAQDDGPADASVLCQFGDGISYNGAGDSDALAWMKGDWVNADYGNRLRLAIEHKPRQVVLTLDIFIGDGPD